MGVFKLLANPPVVVDSAIPSTANATRVYAGVFDNTASLAAVADFALAPTFGAAPTPGPGIVVGLYLVPAVDGANFGSVNPTAPAFPPSTFAGNFVVTLAQAAVQYLPLRVDGLSALKYQVWLDNETGQTISGATLTATPTTEQY